MSRILRAQGVALSLVTGGLDVFHTPNLDRWAAGRRYINYLNSSSVGAASYSVRSHQGRPDTSVGNGSLSNSGAIHAEDRMDVVHTPWMDHSLLCHGGLDWLQLWRYPALWMSLPRFKQALRPEPVLARARL